MGQSLETAVTLQGQVYRQLWPPKLSLLRDPGLPSQRFKGPRTAFHGQLATLGQSLETAVTLQGQVQAVLAAKAVTSKGSRTALPTLQTAQHSFSWAACAYGSKLGDSCDTPGASIQQLCPPKLSLLRDPGLPNAPKGPAQLFMGSLRLWVKAWRQL